MRNFVVKRRPTPAMAVAMLALFVALGGSSYAAVKLAKNSVKAKQIAPNAVGASEIKARAVRSGEVRDGSLLAQDFKAGQLPAGAKGEKGDPGAKGDKGDKGDTGDAGTAVAYATLTSTGTVITSKSKNIDQSNVDDDTQTGAYCLLNLPAGVKSAMVAPQAVFDGGQADVITSFFLNTSGGNVSQGDCTGTILIRTYDTSDASLQDRAFTVWFED
jgi:hypothetical protein